MSESQVIPEAAVYAAQCMECGWRYYALSEQRAHVWGIAHSDDSSGHSVKVAGLQGDSL